MKQSTNMRNFESEYRFVEYPKHVPQADGSYIVVNNAAEEAAARGADEEESEDDTDAERAALFAEAQRLGLSPHHRAGVAKLRELIDVAKQGE